MKKLICMSIVVTLSILGSNAALAECKQFNGRLTGPMFESPCGEFELCITTRSTGTLAGDFVLSFIGNPVNVCKGKVLDTFPTDPLTAGIVSEVVWHTDEGDVFGTDLGVIDFRTFNFASLTTITGGTGKWEGATGQVILGGNDAGTTELSGQICTP